MGTQNQRSRLIVYCVIGLALVMAVVFWIRPLIDGPPASALRVEAFITNRLSAEMQQRLREAELDPAKQKKIWDSEQVTFEMETQFGKPFAKSWAKKDKSALTRFFVTGFSGSVPIPKSTESRQVGTVSSTRFFATNAEPREVDTSGMIDHFLVMLKEFSEVDRSKVRVLKIDNINQDTNRWITRLLLSASGSDKSGKLLDHVSEHTVEFAFKSTDEISGKGDIVKGWRIEHEELRRSEKPLMEEITQRVGLAGLKLPDNWLLPSSEAFQYRFQIGVEDFNRDGFPDIAVALDEGRGLLLRSVKGERFEEVGEALGLRPWNNKESEKPTFLTAWIDFNNDGFVDLVMGPNLYESQQGTNFVDVTSKSGLSFKFDPMGAVVADYDCDGLVDLYVLYQHPEGPKKTDEVLPWVGDTQSGTENHLWRNLGSGRFEDVTVKANAGGGKGRSFAASWMFYDRDRYPDLYIANDFGNNVLLRNRGDGTFEDITKQAGAGSFSTSMGVATADINNDGSPEIYVANMFSKMGRRIIANVSASDYPDGIFEQIVGSCQGNTLFQRASESGGYVELGQQMGINQVGWAYAPAFTDLDGDGFLDIYASAGFLSFDRTKPDG